MFDVKGPACVAFCAWTAEEKSEGLLIDSTEIVPAALSGLDNVVNG